MAVLDDQAATLRALLANRFDEYESKLNALDREAANSGYNTLVGAAFAIAADHRFPEGTKTADIIEYVGSVRSRGEAAARIDPQVAERVLLMVCADADVDDIDPNVQFETQLVLLTALIADRNLSEAEVDAFVSKARKLADRWLA